MELTWPKLYQTSPRSNQKSADTKQLTQKLDKQNKYKEQIKQEIESRSRIKKSDANTLENLKQIIMNAAESQIGYKKKEYPKNKKTYHYRLRNAAAMQKPKNWKSQDI